MNYAFPFVLAMMLAACGGKKNDNQAPQDAAGPATAPLTTPPIGVDGVKRLNYTGDAATHYDRAHTAYNKRPRDWAAVRSQTEAAVAKDPHHLDAHRVLASALAHAGEHAAAVDHLATALAGDYFKYGPSLAKDEDLKEFLANSHGAAITELAGKIRSDYTKRIANSMLIVARRGKFYWPRKDGVQWATSRGELYAFDRETRRYFRLTHTEHQVAGFVRAAEGKEVAVLGFERIDRTVVRDADKKPVLDQPAPLIVKSWVQVFDTTEWKKVGPEIALPANLKMISLAYLDGDRLVISTTPANGAAVAHSVDKAKGKLKKTEMPDMLPRIDFALEEASQHGPHKAFALTLTSPETMTASAFKTSAGGTIRVPESGQVRATSITQSPDGARVAFPTAVDPCAKDAAPSLYVADAKTGALRHVLSARSRFATRWLDATTLAYEDGEGAIRIWDAAIGRETMRLDNKPGIALQVLSLSPSPICKQAPPVEDPDGPGAGSGDDPPPMPPEEGSGGPVTKPQ